MKTCTKCGDEKDDEEFSFKNKKKGTRQSACKACYSDILKTHYKDNKQAHLDRNKASAEKRVQFTRGLKEKNPCLDCGKKYPHYIMEFDHREGKTLCVSSTVSWSWKKMLAEIAKCDIVCSNCHAERTWKRKNAP